MLEDRIQHIVDASPATAPRWPALATSAVLLCALVLLGGARWKEMLSNEQAYQRVVGTWVNLAYPGAQQRSQVTVIRPDNVAEDRPSPTSTVLDGQWTITVKRTWVDDKANNYCQFFGRYIEGSTRKFAGLMRVDKAGKAIEFQYGSYSVAEGTLAFPETIDSNRETYWIYYRQE